MKRAVYLIFLALLLAGLACEGGNVIEPTPPADDPVSVFDSGQTAFGFFPTPPEVSMESLIATFGAIGQHGHVILQQQAIPWAEFIASADGNSKTIQDMRGSLELAHQNGLEIVYITDPLNGLNRTEFAPLPPELADGNFSTPDIRQAFKNFAVRLAREFHPRYLGLASEINTYADAYPDDFPNYLSLYRETYAAVKAESPGTLVFVTFQWEDLSNRGPFNDGSPEGIKWATVEAFEPNLDIWAISSYPYFAFETAADLPADYYTPLLTRTLKPLAVAEGGWPSQDFGPLHGSDEDQIGYLQAINTQIGERLAFWIYLVIDDFDVKAYDRLFAEQGMAGTGETLQWFGVLGLRTKDGDPKPALAVWDGMQNGATATKTVPHEGKWGLYALDLATQSTRLVYSAPREIQILRLNNLGDTLAFAQKIDGDNDGNFEICTVGIDGGNFNRLTDNTYLDVYPAWSADGAQIAFLSQRQTDLDIYVMAADGSSPRRLFDSGAHDADIDWASDRIVFTSNSGLWMIQADGTNPVQITHPPRAGEWGKTNLPFGDYDPRLSPDGSRIVFERLEDDSSPHGNYNFFVINADGSGETRLTTDGASQGLASWSHAGDKLVYVVAAINDQGMYDMHVMNADGTAIHDITPAYFPTTFLVHAAIFSKDDTEIFFIGEWWE